MRNIVKTFLIILFLTSTAWGAMITSTATGDFSAGGTWVGGVAPVDTDGFTVAAGHTVTFDMDQSAWAGMAESTIAATGSLTIKDDGGDYVLKMNGDLNLNGTITAGTSIAVPFTGTFKINYSAGANKMDGSATGRVYFYCLQPTNQLVRLTGGEADDTLAVDTDVTADIWAVGDKVQIIDYDGGGSIDSEEGEIANIAAGEITLTGALAAAKLKDAYVVLITRNIMVTNGTSYAFWQIENSEISCGMDKSCANFAIYPKSTTFTGCVAAATEYNLNAAISSTFDDCVFCGGDASIDGSTGSWGSNVFNDCHFLGCRNCITSAISDTFNDCILSVSYTIGYTNLCVFNRCTFEEIEYPFNISSSISFRECHFKNVPAALVSCNKSTLISCTTTSVDDFMRQSFGNVLYDCDLSGVTTEHTYYNATQAHLSSYTESIDHDQVTNAYKAWTRGGIVTSATADPPTGYTIYYSHACESATYPCYRQYEATVLPGTAIEVSAEIRIQAGDDHSAFPPRLEITDKKADWLVDSSQSPLDYDEIGETDGDVDATYQSTDCIWANTGDSPRQVIVRVVAQHATGIVEEAWSVADYQDQIATIYNIIAPVKTDVATADTTTSFTLTGGTATNDIYNDWTVMVQDADDDHWELRSIDDWTSGKVITVNAAFGFTPAQDDLVYIMGTSYGAPVDLTEVTDETDEIIDRLKRIWDYP